MSAAARAARATHTADVVDVSDFGQFETATRPPAADFAMTTMHNRQRLRPPTERELAAAFEQLHAVGAARAARSEPAARADPAAHASSEFLDSTLQLPHPPPPGPPDGTFVEIRGGDIPWWSNRWTVPLIGTLLAAATLAVLLYLAAADRAPLL